LLPNILIDGYNLAHLMGWLPLFDNETLAKARETLVLHLASLTREPERILVVFDAKNARTSRVPATLLNAPETRHKTGIYVCFATDREADDEIEERLLDNRTRSGGQHKLLIVSNDRRLHAAAKKAKATAMTCQDFFDHMEQVLRAKDPTAPEEAEKPLAPTQEETDRALEDFADLARELNAPKPMTPKPLVPGPKRRREK
jgi:predicted RNA-binding protein with PIN domain